MNKIRVLLPVLLPLAGLLTASIAYAQTTADRQTLYDKIDRVLVSVEYTAEMTFMGQTDDIEGRVLGLSVEPQGTIIFDGTSLGVGAHGAELFGGPRVEKPKSLKITDYKGDTYEAEYIGTDQFSSIAFCRLPDSVKTRITPAAFSNVDMSLGDEIYVFWMLPKGYEPRFQMTSTVVTNVLTKPEKFYLTGELVGDFVMAPVITPAGRIVGVITPMSQTGGMGGPFDMGNAFGTPVGFMPVNRFLELLAKPPAPDEFKRGWLGISLQALDPEIASFWNIDVPGGVIVSDIVPNSPAAIAGLQPEDFIVQVDNAPLEIKDDASLTVFQKMIADRGEGADLDMTVLRPGDSVVDTLQITAVLTAMPTQPSDAPSYEDTSFDMTVRDLVFMDYNVRNLKPGEVQGVVVDKAESGGWAAVDGLNPGDIIMKINDREIKSVDDARAALEGIAKNKDRKAVFMIWRFNKTQFVNVKTHWE